MAVKKSRADRLRKKKAELKSKGGKGNITFIKEGTIRARVLPVSEEDDFVIEVTQFYLGPDIKGVFSPQTFGEPCAIMEKYNSLKESGDPDDKELAKKFSPKKKFLVPVIIMDDRGKSVDGEKGITLLQLTNGLYQELIDLYLDEDEWGDMTDPEDGYDIKFTRTGTTMTDTEYSLKPCKNTTIAKGFEKEVDAEKMVTEIIPTYEETQQKIAQYLNEDVSEDEAPVRKKKIVRKKKKKRNADI